MYVTPYEVDSELSFIPAENNNSKHIHRHTLRHYHTIIIIFEYVIVRCKLLIKYVDPLVLGEVNTSDKIIMKKMSSGVVR